MPLLKMATNAVIADPSADLQALSALLCRELNKPEEFMMVVLEPATNLVFAGSSAPALLAELKSVGLPVAAVPGLSKSLCAWFSRNWGLDPRRVYITFTSVPGEWWGWNGTSFAPS